MINQSSARNLEDFLREVDVFQNFIGMADGNNFYVSCERVFRPELIGKPVIALSNNDGCVISRSQEAKALGIKMGVAEFKIRDLMRQHNVIKCSSRFSLYGNMSKRVMMKLFDFTPELEVSSIDEGFLNFAGMKYVDLNKHGRNIVDITTKDTGIPIAVGVAPTKTLAKLADSIAKKYKGYNNLCIIDKPEKLVKALQITPVEDIWGIGPQLGKRLHAIGVRTAYEFANLSRQWVRQKFTVTGEKTWLELRGVKCFPMTLDTPAKKEICTSRSFGTRVTDYATLSEAIATFASMCAYKLRQQKSFATEIMVFIHTDEYRQDLDQYGVNNVVKLPFYTNDTGDIAHHAEIALREMYRPEFEIKKGGVVVKTANTNIITGNLFVPKDYSKSKRLMDAKDNINERFGRNTLYIGAQGTKNPGKWRMRQNHLSFDFTSDKNNVVEIDTDNGIICVLD